MDADRLTTLLRSWGSAPTRRDLTRALSGTVLAAPLTALLGAFESDAKKRKKKKKKCKKSQKKCGKKCIAKTSCCVDGAEVLDGAICGGPCDVCQGGTCASTCGVDQTCLANGSCGKTCSNNGQCAMGTCSCAAEEGDDPVCRVPLGGPQCMLPSDCVTTADCAAGEVCSTVCGDGGRCAALCDV